MYKSILALCCFLFSLSAISAESVEQPIVNPGDKWVFRLTREKHPNIWNQKHVESNTLRVNTMGILLSTKESGSTLAPSERLVGSDWRTLRTINGEERTVSRPLNFPLDIGKEWGLEYANDQPGKTIQASLHKLAYKVTGWEDVEVPAGKFKALRIEASGKWRAEVKGNVRTSSAQQFSDQDNSVTVIQKNKVVPQEVTGRLYRVYWYMPAAKQVIKSVEEVYGPDGTRQSRITSELVSYQVSP